MNNNVISGLWVALATPLNAQGHVDHPALVRHATWLLDQSCDGLVPFGTTGEGTSFSGAERLAAVEALLAGGIPASRIGLGAGCPAVPDSIALARGALALGLRHVLLLPPYFYRNVDAQGILGCVRAMASSSQASRTAAATSPVSGHFAPPRPMSRYWLAMKPTSPAHWPKGVPARSAAWPIWYPTWCGPCSTIHLPRARCAMRQA